MHMYEEGQSDCGFFSNRPPLSFTSLTSWKLSKSLNSLFNWGLCTICSQVSFTQNSDQYYRNDKWLESSKWRSFIFSLAKRLFRRYISKKYLCTMKLLCPFQLRVFFCYCFLHCFWKFCVTKSKMRSLTCNDRPKNVFCSIKIYIF